MGGYLKKGQQTSNKIVMMGMAFAGKTTLLSRLSIPQPTIKTEALGFTLQRVCYKQYQVTCWDLWSGVQATVFRFHYRRQYQNAKALVFVVSAAKQEAEELENAIVQFDLMLREEAIKNAAILVLVTKLDLSGVTLKEIEFRMNLQQKLSERLWAIRGVNGNTGQGLQQAFEWLEQAMIPLRQ